VTVFPVETLEAAQARASCWEFLARAGELHRLGRWDEFVEAYPELVDELVARVEACT
jgi:hypothetical protein